MEKDFLVDANVLVAYYHIEDALHRETEKIFQDISEESDDEILFHTNNYIISEALTILLYKSKNREVISKLANFFYSAKSNMIISQVDLDWQKKALEIFSSQRSHKLSFSDCVFIAQARRQKIKYIMTFDEDIRSLDLLKNCQFYPN